MTYEQFQTYAPLITLDSTIVETYAVEAEEWSEPFRVKYPAYNADKMARAESAYTLSLIADNVISIQAAQIGERTLKDETVIIPVAALDGLQGQSKKWAAKATRLLVAAGIPEAEFRGFAGEAR
jgi:aconitase A